ncbi:MAG TPA: hypothetical protein VMF10_03040 [Candidatus Aquilonibacter sp.]|nr:hypothetical protein [Candidatus Aquilonibacter sp.]
MRKPRHSAALRSVLGVCVGMLGALLLLSLRFAPAFAPAPVRESSIALAAEPVYLEQVDSKDSPHPPVIRWSETRPGCTFSRGADGKYSYGVWAGDVGVIMAIDAREVQLVHHRIEPILGVLLTVRYRGTDGLDTSPDGIALEFVKHFKVVQPALDPDSYSQKIQADADALDDETRRAIKKHPAEKQTRIEGLQEYQKSANELIEFLNSNSLRAMHLDPATPEERGWVFFDTDTKWIGSWKSQEEFVLRFPLAGKVFEFPFKLPPEPGELLLRKRP